ncbi:MAG: InlB B-repeat-containing protein [Solirubrobacteraceae bacterium]
MSAFTGARVKSNGTATVRAAMGAALTLSLALAGNASAATYNAGTPASLCTPAATSSPAASNCAISTTGLKGVAVDNSTHDLYIVDPIFQRVSQFNEDGTFLRAFGAGVADGTTTGPQVCTSPCFKGTSTGLGNIGAGARGIAIDQTTHIVYVAVNTGRIVYFDGSTGTFLGEFTNATASPAAPASFTQLTGVAIDESGVQHYLYLAMGTGATSAIDKFTVPVGSTTAAGYVCQLTANATPSATECTTTNSVSHVTHAVSNAGIDQAAHKGQNLAVDASGNVYLAESAARGIVTKFKANGQYESSSAIAGVSALAIGKNGNLFVAGGGPTTGATGGTHVLEYSPSDLTTPLSDVGTGTVGNSWGIAIDRGTGATAGELYISDLANAKVWNFASPHTLTVSKTGTGAGTVTSNPAGITCGATCFADFAHGSSVDLTAVASSGSAFTGWSGGGCSGTGTCTVTVDAAKTVTANFGPAFDLTVTRTGSGTGSVSSAPSGIACPATCVASFGGGTEVVLTANASSDSVFTGWSGTAGCSGTGTCTTTMSAAKTATATFTAARTLTVTKTGSGSVVSSPSGINCGTTCSFGYLDGTSVGLTPTPASGWRFDHWTGGCTGSGSCNVSLDADKTVGAVFIQTRDLTVTKTGSGSGSVGNAPTGTGCGTGCSTYDDGTAVVLTATADAGSRFTGWSGACTNATGPCNTTMSAAKTATANFVLTRVLTVTKTGAGAGTVTSDTGGVSCGGVCNATYDDGTAVVLTAVATAGSRFTGWSGACTNATGTCNTTMSAAKTATANFVLTRVLTVTKTGSGAGTVTSDTGGVSCGATCNATYDDGTAVVLTATPAANSTFTGWSGACTNATGTCNTTMGAAKTATANFTQDAPVAVTTAGASSIAQTTATVAGTVNPHGSAVTDCHIEYGTSTSYGSQVACSPASPGAGTSAVDVTGALTGLAAGTLYHFRVVATTAGGTANGEDQTFTTAQVPAPDPTCETDASKCPAPPPTCATDIKLCPVPPTCATDPLLCPPAPTCATDVTLCPAGQLSLPLQLTVTANKAKVKLTCTGETGSACKGTLIITAKVKQGRKTKTIKVGSFTIAMTGGQTKTGTFTVSATARKLIKKHSLKAKIAGAGLSKTITLKQAKRR